MLSGKLGGGEGGLGLFVGDKVGIMLGALCVESNCLLVGTWGGEVVGELR